MIRRGRREEKGTGHLGFQGCRNKWMTNLSLGHTGYLHMELKSKADTDSHPGLACTFLQVQMKLLSYCGNKNVSLMKLLQST